MAGFRKCGNNGCRVNQDSGRQDKIADTLQTVFLKKQIRKVRSGAEHVSQNRYNDQYFHLPAFSCCGRKKKKSSGID
jgi:hypothetical protein